MNVLNRRAPPSTRRPLIEASAGTGEAWTLTAL